MSCCVSCYSHHRAGVGALLRLTLPDEEGPVTLSPQHLLSLRALDVSHVPGALVVVRWALILLQRVGAAKERHIHASGGTTESQATRTTGGSCGNRSPDFISCTYSSASFLIPSHSLIFFCLVPFWFNHLLMQQQHVIQHRPSTRSQRGCSTTFIWLTSGTGLWSCGAAWDPVWGCSSSCRSPCCRTPAPSGPAPACTYCHGSPSLGTSDAQSCSGSWKDSTREKWALPLHYLLCSYWFVALKKDGKEEKEEKKKKKFTFEFLFRCPPAGIAPATLCCSAPESHTAPRRSWWFRWRPRWLFASSAAPADVGPDVIIWIIAKDMCMNVQKEALEHCRGPREAAIIISSFICSCNIKYPSIHFLPTPWSLQGSAGEHPSTTLPLGAKAGWCPQQVASSLQFK